MNIEQIYQIKPNENLPKISPGDTVKVSYRIKEANKERVQTLNGLVIKIRRGHGGGSFTIRRVTSGIGVEHTFPFASPLLEKVQVTRHGKVRRAKLYYIRRLSAKEARLKERRERIEEEAAITAAAEAETAVAEAEKPVEQAVSAELKATAKQKAAEEPKAVKEETAVAEAEKPVEQADTTKPEAAAESEAAVEEKVVAEKPAEDAPTAESEEKTTTSE